MNLAPQIKQQFFDNNGAPLAGGKIYSYLAGTSTLQATYSDSIGTANANPIILDANGECDLWIGSIALKFIIQDSSSNVLRTVDNVSTSPITTIGDLIIGGTNGIWERLAKGTQGYVLQMGSSNKPEWAAKPDLLTAAAKTASYTLLLSDDFVRFDATSGDLVATLPSAVTSTNKVLTLKKTDSSFNKVTMSGTGLTTNYLMTQNETVSYVSDGTNWVQLWRKTDTPWTTYLLTIGGTTTAPTKPNAVVNDIAKWRRVGDSIEFTYQYYHTVAAGSAAGSGSYQFPIPNSSGWTIDSGKIVYPATSTTTNTIVGSAQFSTTSTQIIGGAFLSNSTSIFLFGANETNRTTLGSAGGPITDATVIYTFNAKVPITNFSA